MQASYFLGREVLVAATVPKMPWWRHALFLVMARNAVPATEFFRIPSIAWWSWGCGWRSD